MTTLVLGVVDIPYDEGTVTTGDVAEILEAKYHIMEMFYELHEKDIVAALDEGIKGQLENIMMGAPNASLATAFQEAAGDIEQAFHTMIESRELESLGIAGVPTQAALDGKSLRFMLKLGPRRSSFVDTGLYDQHFTILIEE